MPTVTSTDNEGHLELNSHASQFSYQLVILKMSQSSIDRYLGAAMPITLVLLMLLLLMFMSLHYQYCGPEMH